MDVAAAKDDWVCGSSCCCCCCCPEACHCCWRIDCWLRCAAAAACIIAEMACHELASCGPRHNDWRGAYGSGEGNGASLS
eukprot:6208098-Pleurochrysis_carterae.AAC.1